MGNDKEINLKLFHDTALAMLLKDISTVVDSVLLGNKRCEVKLPDGMSVLAYRCGTVLRIDIKGLVELNGH